jgi:hypothetical protein
LWDVFIINGVEQLQTWPKTQSEIDISPFLKTQKPSSSLVVDFGHVLSGSTMFIMKTSHKSDEFKIKIKIGYLWATGGIKFWESAISSITY